MADNINPRYLPYSKQEVQQILAQVETIDTTPTEGSTNPIGSGAVKEALDTKQPVISDLEEIRANAGSGATAVQFEENADPASLFDEDSSD